MKEVTGEVDLHWDGRLVIVGWPQKKAELMEMFRKGLEQDRAPVRLRFAFSKAQGLPKTKRQLGYLYGHLGPVALRYFQDSGWPLLGTGRGKDMAIEEMAKVLGFVDEFRNEFTGEAIYRVKSIKDAEKEDLQVFIEALYFHLLDLGCDVIHPEEYSKPTR